MNKKILKHSFSLLHVDYAKLNQHWNFKNIISPYYRLYFIDDGEGAISNEHETLVLEPGYLYMIPSFTPCNLSCTDYLSQYFIQFFEDSFDGISLFGNNRKLMRVAATSLDIEVFKQLLHINPGRGINRSNDPKVYEKNVYYKEYQELNNLQSHATYMETQGIILQLVSKFLNAETFTSSNAGPVPSKILETISYIQVNLKENLTVTHLSERANQHPDHFSRVFLRYTGERPVAFIHQKRIERAQFLITTTNMTYEEVAFETGFDNVPYFSRIFKRVTGLTPGKYREQNRSSY